MRIASPNAPGERHSAISGYIMPVLVHLPPQDTLRTIIFRIESNQYHKRARFLDEVSSAKMDEVLSKFPNLETVGFSLDEQRSIGYSAERWRSLLTHHMPKLGRSVSISAQMNWYRCVNVPHVNALCDELA